MIAFDIEDRLGGTSPGVGGMSGKSRNLVRTRVLKMMGFLMNAHSFNCMDRCEEQVCLF